MIKSFQIVKFWLNNQNSKNIFFKKGTFIAYPFLALLITLTGCEPNNNLGLEVQPSDDQIAVFFTDSLDLSLKTYQLPPDSFTIYHADMNAPSLPMGAYNDPIYGMVDAQMVLQFTEAGDKPEENYNLDSAVFILSMGDCYQFGREGATDPTSYPMTYEIYKLTDELSNSDTVKADYEPQYDPNPIARLENATVSFSSDSTDSTEFLGILLGPSLLFTLDQTYAEYLMSLDNPQDENGFLIKAFDPEGLSVDEGTVLTTLPLQGDGTEVIFIYNTDEQDSLIRVLYATAGTSTSGSGAVYFSKINHDYTGTLAEQALADPYNEDFAFLQSGNGLKTQIKIQDLEAFAMQTNMAINYAELVLPVLEGDEYPGVSGFFGFELTEQGTVGSIILAPNPGGEPDTFVYGSYDEDCNCYKFDLTLYVQDQVEMIRSGEDANYGFMTVPSADFQNVSRSLFAGTTGSDKLKLNITYTPIK